MEFTLYLVELLRLHDCVIVPDLGGFVCNYRPAEMDLAGNSFKPPVKEIIFTGKLSKNDGLLVNYISEIEGVGYMEARQMISEFVDETWSKLENREKITFRRIGSLQFDRNEKLIFEPDIHENYLLEAYGLEGFQFPQLEHKEIISAKRVFTGKEAIRPVLKSRKVKALVIGIPVLLALVFIPVSRYSLKNNSPVTLQTSSTTSFPINGPLVPSAFADHDSAALLKPSAIRIESSASQSHTDLLKPIDPAKLSNLRYRIIGGCFKIRLNADHFLEKLQENGFKSELKVLPNGTFLVIVQSYSDRNEAMTAMNSLRLNDPKAGYWMSAN
jgi:nucleoid DNA-binding protein